ncbi:MAG: carboxypeptidase-like regulatory domain-containing protein [Vicinamibacterales bacterium]
MTHFPSVFRAIVAVAFVLASAAAFAQGDPNAPPRPGGGQGAGPGQGGRGPARAQAGRPPAELPKGTSVLRGQIVAADNGSPIRRAQVRVSSTEARDGRVATTDAQGRFEIKELVAGRYTMTASKAGFVSLQYGQRRASESGTPIELGDGQTLDKLAIALPRGSVLAGRITDEFGEPVANATVIAMRYAYAAGARRMTPTGAQNARDTTDDQGHYRLFGLPPGAYYVTAMLRTGGPEITDPMGGEQSGYAPTYYPGTPNVNEAQRVTLAVSQENSNVSFGLIATKLVKLSGLVITSQGTPAINGVVMLVASGGAGGRAALQGGNGSRVDQTGAFRMTNVAPGRYQVQARLGGRGEGELAKMDLTVGADDVDGLMLITAPGAKVGGNVVSDTGDPFDFRPQQLQIAARVADADAQMIGAGGGQARVGDDWAFELANLSDARLIRAAAPQGWTLKSVNLNGQDITDVPTEFPPGQTLTGLQVTLTRKVSALTGVVADDKGKPVLDATVIIFPADEKLWTYQSRFIKAARPDQDGTYRVTALPPNEAYLAVALQGLEDGQAGDPEFLATIKDTAAKFSLGDGETKAVDVKLSTRQ